MVAGGLWFGRRRIGVFLLALACTLGGVVVAKPASAVMQAAQQEFDKGNYGKVIKLLYDDRSVEALILKGRCFYECDIGGAVEAFYDAANVAPKNAEAIAWKAYAELRRKHFAAAVLEGKRAVALDPRNATAHAWLGRCLYRIGKTDDAVAESNEAVKLDSNSIVAGENLADTYVDQFENKKALQTLTDVIAQHPNMPQPHLRKAELYENSGDRERAMYEYSEAIKLNPAYQYGRFQRGHLYFFNKDFDKALTDCNVCIALEQPQEVCDKCRELRVKTYEQLKRWNDAIADLNFLLRNVPQMKHLSGTVKKQLIERAQDYAKLKDFTKAMASVDFVLNIEPTRTEALLLKARLAVKAKDYRVALNNYNMLIAVDNSMPGWYRERADVYKQMGNAAAAERDMQSALQLEKTM